MSRTVKTGSRWAGVSRAEQMDMQVAIKRGATHARMTAEGQERMRKNIQYLRDNYSHTKNVKLGKLVYYINNLGLDTVAEVARKNLSAFHFCQQCEKALSNKR